MSATPHDPALLDDDLAVPPEAGDDVPRTDARCEAGALRRAMRRLQEQNLELERAKSAAEKANLAKSAFLCSLSHDLRSPLNAILGFAQLIDSQSPTPAQKESIAQILEAGWRLLNLIDEGLNLAAIEPGKGSLPGEPVSLDEDVAPPVQDVASGARPRTVLCVDDNPANLKLMEELIKLRPNVGLLTAANARSGIELARTSHPEVILMDIYLPDISGVEALKVLRLDPATARIPVVAISAEAMPRDIEIGMKKGFFSYLTKPIKVKELMAAVDAALAFSARRPD